MMAKKEIKFGVVSLKDWIKAPVDNVLYQHIAGPCKLITAKDFDFVPRSGESNWAVVVGSEGDIQTTILGCQIRAITEFPQPIEARPETWKLQ